MSDGNKMIPGAIRFGPTVSVGDAYRGVVVFRRDPETDRLRRRVATLERRLARVLKGWADFDAQMAEEFGARRWIGPRGSMRSVPFVRGRVWSSKRLRREGQ